MGWGLKGLAVVMGWRLGGTCCCHGMAIGGSSHSMHRGVRGQSVGMDFSVYHVGSGDGIQVVSHYRGHHGASELSQLLSQSLMTFLTVLESKLECWELP